MWKKKIRNTTISKKGEVMRFIIPRIGNGGVTSVMPTPPEKRPAGDVKLLSPSSSTLYDI